MSYRNYKHFVWAGFFILPLVFHAFNTYKYAPGGYDGKHCAGLLDAIWECTEFEYYIDWMFNPITIFGLLGSYLAAFFIAVVAIICGNKLLKNE